MTEETPQFDPEARELCPDDTCIGLIGPDGTCRECGAPSPSANQDPRSRGLRSEAEVAARLEANITVGDLAAAPADFEDRELCPDGTCIGVLDAEGVCRECGTPTKAAGGGT